MIAKTELERWLGTLPEGDGIFVDEGGVALRSLKDQEAYLEVGGQPDTDFTEQPMEALTAKQVVDRYLAESRFSVPLPNGGRFDYGYDRPLQYYFFQVWKNGQIVDSDEMGGCTASDILEALEKYHIKLPDDHMNALMSDLPFPDPNNTGYGGHSAVFDNS